MFERALRTFEDLRRAGAASLDLAWTARGCSTATSSRPSGRGTSPPARSSCARPGGVVTDWDGDDRAWLWSGDIVAAPPAVHARTLEIIRGRALVARRVLKPNTSSRSGP